MHEPGKCTAGTREQPLYHSALVPNILLCMVLLNSKRKRSFDHPAKNHDPGYYYLNRSNRPVYLNFTSLAVFELGARNPETLFNQSGYLQLFTHCISSTLFTSRSVLHAVR